MQFLIITGMSGAGKSETVKHMEDLGFFCVDNLPPILIPKFVEICCQSSDKIDKVALVIDIRGGKLLRDFFPNLKALEEAGVAYEILFLEASDNSLIKRFKASRRMHPLAKGGRISTGIKQEREILEEIKKNAKHIIDTSNLSLKQLKKEISNIFISGKTFEGMILSFNSFGFKYGTPSDCDLIFDVRFLPNPYYIENLRKFSGEQDVIKEYVFGFEETHTFISKLVDMLNFLIPLYIKEGKTQLVVGIGCTGGRHRSVAISRELQTLFENKNYISILEHRDIDKDNRGAN